MTRRELRDRALALDAANKAAVEAALKADREAALRDVFACSAMAALIATKDGALPYGVAEDAYIFADAMLAVRKAGA